MALDQVASCCRENAVRACFTTVILIALQLNPKEQYAHFPPEHGKQTVLVLKVVDGDTVDAAFLVPFRARLYGMNAPEKNTDAGKLSAEALSAMLKPINMVDCELKGREKFGRQLVDLKLDGKSVTNLMIGSGHAKQWDGQGVRP